MKFVLKGIFGFCTARCEQEALSYKHDEANLKLWNPSRETLHLKEKSNVIC